MTTHFNDIELSRSYATEANLNKMLATCDLTDVPVMVVCNRKGRFTALFQLHALQAHNITIAYVCSLGFKVFG